MIHRKLKRSVKLSFVLTAVLVIAFFVYLNVTAVKAKSALNSELGEAITLQASDFIVNLPKNAEVSFVSDLSTIDVNALGTHEIQIKVNSKTYTSSIHIVDTVDPLVTVQPGSLEVGGSLEASSLIVSITDKSATTVSFKKAPDFDTVGPQEVTVVVCDASGNATETKTTLEVAFDLTAPVIEEQRQLYVAVNSANPDYWANATATDAKSAIASKTFNDDKVKLNRLGTYEVTLTATDAEGNEVSITRSVKVVMETSYLTMQGLANPENNKADDFVTAVLAEIIKPDMTRNQKIRAVYDWLLNEISYQTDTSHDYATDSYNKMDDYAVIGFTKFKGHCFHYASMAAELLDTLGLEITLVKGDGYSSTAASHFILHYWVMLRIDGVNYHFDPLYEYLYKVKAHKYINFYLVKDADIYDITHRWDQSLYPTAP